MKRLVVLFCLIFCLAGVTKSEDFDNVQLDLRGYHTVQVPEGTFIPVMNAQEISTQYCSEGYKVSFIVTNDLYMYDTNIIPKETLISGYIEKINEPVVGTNASMKIKIFRLTLPDGFSMPVKGYIYTSNENIIGGELTSPSEWVKVPHYQDKYQRIAWNYRGPTLQIRQGGKRSMGIHTKLPVGDRQLIILTAPAEFTHTVEE